MRTTVLSLLALVAFSAVAVHAFGPLPTDCNGPQNSVPLTQFDPTVPTVKTVTNGTLQSVLASNATTPMLVAHLYGDDYSMGFAYGELLEDTLQEMIPLAYKYFSTKYHIPEELIDALLDMTRNTTMKFTPKHHFAFMQGVSDGTGNTTTFEQFWRMAMIPELIKAACSIAGAWGPATANGGLIQLRALDWGTDGPFQQWPLLTVFHPNDGSYAYSSLGWVGLYGTLTGYSSSNMAVSEKVWDAYKGLDNIFGYPWTLMLADIMRFDQDIDSALARIGQSVRTCAIWVGIGQGARQNPYDDTTIPADFKLLGDSFEELHTYNPTNFPYYPPHHTYFPSLLYVNKHVQPSSEQCMNDLFNATYGELTAEVFYTTITAMETTGDMHIQVTDFDAKTLYIANAAIAGGPPAYENGFIQFDAAALFAQPAPSVQFEKEIRQTETIAQQ